MVRCSWMLADCACGVAERVEEGARGSRAMKTVKPAVVAETAPQWRGFACVFASRQARSRGKRRRTFCTPSQQERVKLQPVHCRHGLVSDASVISSFVFHTGRRRLTFWCFGREVPLFFFCFANVYKRPTLFITFGRNSAPTGSDIVDRQNMWLRYVFHRPVIFECLQVKKYFY